MSQFDSGMSGYIRAKAPESAEPSKPAREPERWRFFVADQYRPAGMSPREDGEWVKWADAESYASERVAQLEKQVEGLSAALRERANDFRHPSMQEHEFSAETIAAELDKLAATQFPTAPQEAK